MHCVWTRACFEWAVRFVTELGRWIVSLHPFPLAQPPHTTRARPSSFRTTEHENSPFRNVTRPGAAAHGSCSPRDRLVESTSRVVKLQPPSAPSSAERCRPIWICGRGASAHKSHSNFSVPQMQLCIKKVNDWNFGKYWRVNSARGFHPRRTKKREKRPGGTVWHSHIFKWEWVGPRADGALWQTFMYIREGVLFNCETNWTNWANLSRAGGLLSTLTRSESIGILRSVIEGCFCIGTALPDGVGPCVRAAPQSAAAGENRPSFCWASACLLPACLPRRPAFFLLNNSSPGFINAEWVVRTLPSLCVSTP